MEDFTVEWFEGHTPHTNTLNLAAYRSKSNLIKRLSLDYTGQADLQHF